MKIQDLFESYVIVRPSQAKIAPNLQEAAAPSIWYHGSNSKISAFTLDNVSNPDATHQEGPGIYLTSSIDDARRYGKFVHVVKARAAKSRMMPDKRMINADFIRRLILSAPDADDNLSNFGEHKQSAANEATKQIMDSFGPKDYREAMEQVWGDHYRGEEQVFLSKMRSIGWDGFILVRTDSVKHFICFNPRILSIQEVL